MHAFQITNGLHEIIVLLGSNDNTLEGYDDRFAYLQRRSNTFRQYIENGDRWIAPAYAALEEVLVRMSRNRLRGLLKRENAQIEGIALLRGAIDRIRWAADEEVPR